MDFLLLQKRIMERIASEKKRLAFRRRFLAYSSVSFISLGGGLWSFFALRASLVESGFFKFFSLLFSDFQIVVSLWRNFALSLIEALPIATLMMFCLFALAIIFSFKKLYEAMPRIAHF